MTQPLLIPGDVSPVEARILDSQVSISGEELSPYVLSHRMSGFASMQLVRLLFDYIDHAPRNEMHRLVLADDGEAWSLLSDMAGNPTLSSTVCSALAYEDTACGLVTPLTANPATSDDTIDVLDSMVRDASSLLGRPGEDFALGLVRRPNLTPRHFDLLMGEALATEPFGVPFRWSPTPDADEESEIGWGPVVSTMLDPRWQHADKLTESHRSQLYILAASTH